MQKYMSLGALSSMACFMLQVGQTWASVCASADCGVLQTGARICAPDHVGHLVLSCALQGMLLLAVSSKAAWIK